MRFEKLENRNMMAGDVCFPSEVPDECGDPTWHNVAIPTDVSNNGQTTAFDALLIINEMNRNSYTDPNNGFKLVDPAVVDNHPEIYYDVNNDGRGSALDALNVINQIARERNLAEAEQSVPISYFDDFYKDEF